VTLTATVSGGQTVGGTVTFLDGTTQIKTVAFSGGTVSTTTTSLGAGGHALKAVYSGSATHQPSESAVLTQTVVAGSTGGGGSGSTGGGGSGSTGGGGGGAVAAPPVGSRFQQVVPPRRVASDKCVGAAKVRTVALPARADLRGAAVNVTVTTGKKATTVAVCSGHVSKAACKARPLMKLGRGMRQAKFSLLDLNGPSIKLYNLHGTSRFTVDVQGWYVNDSTKARFTALVSPQRVLNDKKLGPGTAVKMTIPARLRPAGTQAVELNVLSSAATRASSVAVCRAVVSKRACLARPTLFSKALGKVANRVIVPIRANAVSNW